MTPHFTPTGKNTINNQTFQPVFQEVVASLCLRARATRGNLERGLRRGEGALSAQEKFFGTLHPLSLPMAGPEKKNSLVPFGNGETVVSPAWFPPAAPCLSLEKTRCLPAGRRGQEGPQQKAAAVVTGAVTGKPRNSPWPSSCRLHGLDPSRGGEAPRQHQGPHLAYELKPQERQAGWEGAKLLPCLETAPESGCLLL